MIYHSYTLTTYWRSVWACAHCPRQWKDMPTTAPPSVLLHLLNLLLRQYAFHHNRCIWFHLIAVSSFFPLTFMWHLWSQDKQPSESISMPSFIPLSHIWCVTHLLGNKHQQKSFFFPFLLIDCDYGFTDIHLCGIPSTDRSSDLDLDWVNLFSDFALHLWFMEPHSGITLVSPFMLTCEQPPVGSFWVIKNQSTCCHLASPTFRLSGWKSGQGVSVPLNSHHYPPHIQK